MVFSRKRKDNRSPSLILDDSPKRTKVQAQRKFAAGSNINSPVITPIKELEKNEKSIPEPIELVPMKRPNTEDFLTFLCFRGTPVLPPSLNFFNNASMIDTRTQSETSSASPKNGLMFPCTITKSAERPFIAFGVRKRADPIVVSRHMDKKRRHALALQALRRKYQEQKMAKIRAITISKLSEKVQTNKTVVRTTRSITKTGPISKKNISQKTKITVVATKLKVTTRRRTNTITTNTVTNIVKQTLGRSKIKPKMCLRSYRGRFVQRELVNKAAKKATISRGIIKRIVKQRKVQVTEETEEEEEEEFSSDDDEPLVNTVKLSKRIVKKNVVGAKKLTENSLRQTRSNMLSHAPLVRLRRQPIKNRLLVRAENQLKSPQTSPRLRGRPLKRNIKIIKKQDIKKPINKKIELKSNHPIGVLKRNLRNTLVQTAKRHLQTRPVLKKEVNKIVKNKDIMEKQKMETLKMVKKESKDKVSKRDVEAIKPLDEKEAKKINADIGNKETLKTKKVDDKKDTPKILKRDTPKIIKKETPKLTKKDVDKKTNPKASKKENDKIDTPKITKKDDKKDTPKILNKKDDDKKDSPKIIKKDNDKKDTPKIIRKDSDKKDTPKIIKKEDKKDTPKIINKKDDDKKDMMKVIKKDHDKKDISKMKKDEDEDTSKLNNKKHDETKDSSKIINKKHDDTRDTPKLINKKHDDTKDTSKIIKKKPDDTKDKPKIINKKGNDKNDASKIINKKEDDKKDTSKLIKKDVDKKDAPKIINKKPNDKYEIPNITNKQEDDKKDTPKLTKKDDDKKDTPKPMKKEDDKKDTPKILKKNDDKKDTPKMIKEDIHKNIKKEEIPKSIKKVLSKTLKDTKKDAHNSIKTGVDVKKEIKKTPKKITTKLIKKDESLKLDKKEETSKLNKQNETLKLAKKDETATLNTKEDLTKEVIKLPKKEDPSLKLKKKDEISKLTKREIMKIKEDAKKKEEMMSRETLEEVEKLSKLTRKISLNSDIDVESEDTSQIRLEENRLVKKLVEKPKLAMPPTEKKVILKNKSDSLLENRNECNVEAITIENEDEISLKEYAKFLPKTISNPKDVNTKEPMPFIKEINKMPVHIGLAKNDDSKIINVEIKKKIEEVNKKDEASKTVEEQSKKADELKKKGEDTKKKSEETKKKNEETKKKGEIVKNNDEELKKNNDELKKKGEEAKKKAEELKKRGEEARKKGEEAQKKAEELKKKGEEMKRKVEELKKKGEDARKKSEELKKKCDNIKKKSDETKKKVEKKYLDKKESKKSEFRTINSPKRTVEEVKVTQRPSRKTKEAAAIYMEILGHKLVNDGEFDDNVSIDSFPELPNVRKMEQRENELKAIAKNNKNIETSEKKEELTAVPVQENYLKDKIVLKTEFSRDDVVKPIIIPEKSKKDLVKEMQDLANEIKLEKKEVALIQEKLKKELILQQANFVKKPGVEDNKIVNMQEHIKPDIKLEPKAEIFKIIPSLEIFKETSMIDENIKAKAALFQENIMKEVAKDYKLAKKKEAVIIGDKSKKQIFKETLKVTTLNEGHLGENIVKIHECEKNIIKKLDELKLSKETGIKSLVSNVDQVAKKLFINSPILVKDRIELIDVGANLIEDSSLSLIKGSPKILPSSSLSLNLLNNDSKLLQSTSKVTKVSTNVEKPKSIKRKSNSKLSSDKSESEDSIKQVSKVRKSDTKKGLQKSETLIEKRQTRHKDNKPVLDISFSDSDSSFVANIAVPTEKLERQTRNKSPKLYKSFSDTDTEEEMIEVKKSTKRKSENLNTSDASATSKSNKKTKKMALKKSDKSFSDSDEEPLVNFTQNKSKHEDSKLNTDDSLNTDKDKLNASKKLGRKSAKIGSENIIGKQKRECTKRPQNYLPIFSSSDEEEKYFHGFMEAPTVKPKTSKADPSIELFFHKDIGRRYGNEKVNMSNEQIEKWLNDSALAGMSIKKENDEMLKFGEKIPTETSLAANSLTNINTENLKSSLLKPENTSFKEDTSEKKVASVPSTPEKPISPTKPLSNERKTIFRKEKTTPLRKINAFSVANESSVYAFEADTEDSVSTPFRRPSRRPSSTATSNNTEDELSKLDPEHQKAMFRLPNLRKSDPISSKSDPKKHEISTDESDKSGSLLVSNSVEITPTSGDETHTFYVPLQPGNKLNLVNKILKIGSKEEKYEDKMAKLEEKVRKGGLMSKKTELKGETSYLGECSKLIKLEKPIASSSPMYPPLNPMQKNRLEKNTTKLGSSKSFDRLSETSEDFKYKVPSSPSASSSSSAKLYKRQKAKIRQESLYTPVNASEFPNLLDSSQIVEAPVFHPNEKEFTDPLEYLEKIRNKAEKFGICRIIPPANFKPECKVLDEMRFTAYNQYVHKMMDRWGPNFRELVAIRKYLATQSITLNHPHPPWIGGMEIDLPRLYQTVQSLGGLSEVIDKKKWSRVSELMKIPKSAQDRFSKLDDMYIKYLLPYDTLSTDERDKLFDSVETSWAKRESKNLLKAQQEQGASDKNFEETEREVEGDEDDESEDEQDIECIVKGRSMALNAFYRIARNTMAMWFKGPGTSAEEVEEEFWKHVTTKKHHICVHSGSIDSGNWGYGFAITKNSPFARHAWNLKVLTNNSGSVLRSMGPVMGLTVPTLHVGMVFSGCCWYRDPHSLPWLEYLHTGANKIWYGIPDGMSAKFHETLKKLLPNYCLNKELWLPSDTAMLPPNLLVDNGVSLTRTVQKPGEFVVIFPKAFTSNICTGYCVSESVFYAPPDWLTCARNVFDTLRNCCEPSMFSYERLLLCIATDPRSDVNVLKMIIPAVQTLCDREKKEREKVISLGIESLEKLPLPDKKKKKGNETEIEYECEDCRWNLFSSMVCENQENYYCLEHAIQHIQNKRLEIDKCKLLFTYDTSELVGLTDKVRATIEMKIQKKAGSKFVGMPTLLNR